MSASHVRFSPDFLQRLRDALPVSHVLGKYIRLERRGHSIKACCPFHKEKTPSFTVQDDKQFYHCFGCGAHGDVIRFVMEHEGRNFPEAVEMLAGMAGIPMPQGDAPDPAALAKRQKSRDLLDAACQWFQSQLASSQGMSARRYLQERGVTDAAIAEFQLGYAPDNRHALIKAASGAGFNERMIVEQGLAIRPDSGSAYDRFRGRVMFPIHDRQGRVVAFGGRILGDGQPKYLNSPETPLFHKSHVLFNAHRARKLAHNNGRLLIVEGYTDVIALHQAGIGESVAPLGTAITEHHLQQCWQMVDVPTLCLDGDAAGVRAMHRAAELALPHLQPGKSLAFLLLPKGEDPDSLVQRHGRGAFEQLWQRPTPLAEALWRSALEKVMAGKGRGAESHPSSLMPEEKAALEKQLQGWAAQIQDVSVQAHYQRHFKDRCWREFRPPKAAFGSGKGAGNMRGRASGRLAPHVVNRNPRALAERELMGLLLRFPLIVTEGDVEERLASLHLQDGGCHKARQLLLNWLAMDGDSEVALQQRLRDEGLGDLSLAAGRDGESARNAVREMLGKLEENDAEASSKAAMPEEWTEESWNAYVQSLEKA